MENKLEETWRSLGRDKSPEQQFIDRAKFLMNKVFLVAGESKFRIVDCEAYYHSGMENHCDPFVHCVANNKTELVRDDQLQCGTWFFNDAGGVDITFGRRLMIDHENIYGGFLIR